MNYAIVELGAIAVASEQVTSCAYHNGIVMYVIKNPKKIKAASLINGVLTSLPGEITFDDKGYSYSVKHIGNGIFCIIDYYGNMKAFSYDQGNNTFISLSSWTSMNFSYVYHTVLAENFDIVLLTQDAVAIVRYNNGSFTMVFNESTRTTANKTCYYKQGYLYISHSYGSNPKISKFTLTTGLPLISIIPVSLRNFDAVCQYGIYTIGFLDGQYLEAFIDNGDTTMSQVGNTLTALPEYASYLSSLSVIGDFIVLKASSGSGNCYLDFYKFNGQDFILYGRKLDTPIDSTMGDDGDSVSIESSFIIYSNGGTKLLTTTFKPQATFAVDKTSGAAPLTVNFTAEALV
jgi:hypothetical protein